MWLSSDQIEMRTEFKSDYILKKDDLEERGIPEKLHTFYSRWYFKNAYGVDKWYHSIEEYTFRTVMIEMTFEEAKAVLLCSYMKAERHHDDLQPYLPVLEQLKHRVDECIEKNGFLQNGFFAKLNTRSGKDAPLYDKEDADSKIRLRVKALTRILLTHLARISPA